MPGGLYGQFRSVTKLAATRSLRTQHLFVLVRPGAMQHWTDWSLFALLSEQHQNPNRLRGNPPVRMACNYCTASNSVLKTNWLEYGDLGEHYQALKHFAQFEDTITVADGEVEAELNGEVKAT